MPIDGLTDIDRAPRQGMLRLGIKKKTTDGKKEYPSEVDYFILDPETPNPLDKKIIIDNFFAVFGINPKTIEVMLISSDINKTFPQNYKRYGKNTPLKCIGDGKTATVTEKDWGKGLNQVGVDERGFMQVECKGRDCIYATANDKSQNKECKATATLSVNMPQLGGLGVWQLTTGSFNSIVNINSGIRELNEIYGRCHGIPLMLERRPQETAYKGKKALHYTLHLNETSQTAEAARALQASMFEELEKADEILDGDDHEMHSTFSPADIEDTAGKAAEENEINRLAEADREQGVAVKVPGEKGTPGEAHGTGTTLGVVEAVYKDAEEIQKKEIADKAVGAVQENTKPENATGAANSAAREQAKEVLEKVDKVTKAFDGVPADNDSKEFLDGLKKDAKAELGVEGGQPVKSRSIDKEQAEITKTVLDTVKERCPDVPDSFPPFMAWCKAKLEAADKGKMYKDAFDLYSVKTPADLSKDLEKQGKMRIYLSSLLLDEGLV